MQKWLLTQIGYDQTLAFQVQKQDFRPGKCQEMDEESKRKVYMSHFTDPR